MSLSAKRVGVGADRFHAVRRRERPEVDHDRLARGADRRRGHQPVAVERHGFGARGPERVHDELQVGVGDPVGGRDLRHQPESTTASDNFTRRPDPEIGRRTGLRRDQPFGACSRSQPTDRAGSPRTAPWRVATRSSRTALSRSVICERRFSIREMSRCLPRRLSLSARARVVRGGDEAEAEKREHNEKRRGSSAKHTAKLAKQLTDAARVLLRAAPRPAPAWALRPRSSVAGSSGSGTTSTHPSSSNDLHAVDEVERSVLVRSTNSRITRALALPRRRRPSPRRSPGEDSPRTIVDNGSPLVATWSSTCSSAATPSNAGRNDGNATPPRRSAASDAPTRGWPRRGGSRPTAWSTRCRCRRSPRSSLVSDGLSTGRAIGPMPRCAAMVTNTIWPCSPDRIVPSSSTNTMRSPSGDSTAPTSAPDDRTRPATFAACVVGVECRGGRCRGVRVQRPARRRRPWTSTLGNTRLVAPYARSSTILRLRSASLATSTVSMSAAA